MNFNISKGFTLIETLVAVSLLVIAIAGPMSLAAQSLSSAFYARDQMTAFHLAQEAIEAVRFVRDSNMLINNVAGTPIVDILQGIPKTDGSPMIVDIRNNTITACDPTCPPLKTNGTLFGYEPDTNLDWQMTRFTRTMFVTFVNNNNPDEIKVRIEVKWRSGAFQERTIVMSENMHRWLPDTISN